MSALASLLLRDQALPMEQVEEAIQTQVTRGGNLDTVLLELGMLRENEVNAYCAAVWALLPGTRDEVMSASLSTTRVLPREFAVRYRVIPVARTEETVVLAVDRPLAAASLREIRLDLGVEPAQRVVCTLRLEVGLAQHYDIRLTARMRALKEQLDRVDAGPVPFVAAYAGTPSRSSLPPADPDGAGRRRVQTIPAPETIAENDCSPWTTAPTAPPPPPSTVVALTSSRNASGSPVPAKKSSVPAGTFGQSSASLRAPKPPSGLELGFSSATRYSLPPRDAEVLGRPSGSHRRPSQPSQRRSRPPVDGAAPSDSAQSWRARSRPPEPGETQGRTPSTDQASPAPRSQAPRFRGRRRSTVPPESELALPSVIVDVDQEVERHVAELRATGPEDEVAMLPLLAAGEAALPALTREFPGGLWFDRHRPYASLPNGRDVSPIARAFVAFGEMAVPYVASLVDDHDVDRRFYACLLAAEFIHPELVGPVGRRIFDRDAGVRTAAFRALSVLWVCKEEFDGLLETLRSTARAPGDPERRLAAIEALGRLRDVGSFELLLSMLASRDAELVRSAHASLVRLSGQDFGTNIRKWTQWHQRNASKHRIEWLIDALMHSDMRLRRRAGEELKHVTQEYFGYQPDLSRRDRERARKKYLSWWEQVGCRMFTQDGQTGPGQAEDE